MFSKIGKLLTYSIENYDLYNFAVRLIAKVALIMGDNPTLAPYVTAVSNAVKEMRKVFKRYRFFSAGFHLNLPEGWSFEGWRV